jgi:hypothetical protein
VLINIYVAPSLTRRRFDLKLGLQVKWVNSGWFCYVSFDFTLEKCFCKKLFFLICFFIIFRLFWYDDVKNKFKKKYYFNAFLNEKYFKK